MPNHAPLSADAHRDLRLHTGHGEALGDATMACITTPHEFRQVQAHYPILFRRRADGRGFDALALFGFDNGENLFLDGERWDAEYVPHAIAVRPLLIGHGAGDTRAVHVDMDSPRVATGDAGVRAFDADGRPSPYLEQAIERLGALDAGYQASDAFFAALERHALVEPLTLEVTLADGATNRLVGYHVIDEDALRGLLGDALGELQRDGHLMPIFMAVASLANFTALIARKNRRG